MTPAPDTARGTARASSTVPLGRKAEPQRVQRRRVKGWRMPAGAVYVGRGSKWGNRHTVRQCGSPTAAVARYLEDLQHELADAGWLVAAVAQLRGRHLACWCPLDAPCHADVLLELVNSSDAHHVAPGTGGVSQSERIERPAGGAS